MPNHCCDFEVDVAHVQSGGLNERIAWKSYQKTITNDTTKNNVTEIPTAKKWKTKDN